MGQELELGTASRRRHGWAPPLVLTCLAVTLLLSAGAAAQTPERPSPFTPRAEPAADQYTSPPASGAASATPSPAPPGNTADARDRSQERDAAGRDTAGRGRQGVRDAEPTAPLPVPATGGRGVVDDAAGELPFTGGALGTLLLLAAALLAAGFALRAYGSRSKPGGRRIRGLR